MHDFVIRLSFLIICLIYDFDILGLSLRTYGFSDFIYDGAIFNNSSFPRKKKEKEISINNLYRARKRERSVY